MLFNAESDDGEEPSAEAKKDDIVEENEKEQPVDDATIEEKEIFDPNNHPEQPKETNSANGVKEGSHASSDLGFPDLEDGSEGGGVI